MGQTKVSLALSYASRGWHVFPITKGTTNKPRVKWGTAATTNAKTIKEWWKAWPDDNIGLACGPSGLCVVDVDMKKGKNGSAEIMALELPRRARFRCWVRYHHMDAAGSVIDHSDRIFHCRDRGRRLLIEALEVTRMPHADTAGWVTMRRISA